MLSHPWPASTEERPRISRKKARSASASSLNRITWAPKIMVCSFRMSRQRKTEEKSADPDCEPSRSIIFQAMTRETILTCGASASLHATPTGRFENRPNVQAKLAALANSDGDPRLAVLVDFVDAGRPGALDHLFHEGYGFAVDSVAGLRPFGRDRDEANYVADSKCFRVRHCSRSRAWWRAPGFKSSPESPANGSDRGCRRRGCRRPICRRNGAAVSRRRPT